MLLDYKLEAYQRESNALAPAGFKQSCWTVLGKAPILEDGMLIQLESGAITEYVHFQASSSILHFPSSIILSLRLTLRHFCVIRSLALYVLQRHLDNLAFLSPRCYALREDGLDREYYRCVSNGDMVSTKCLLLPRFNLISKQSTS